MIKKNLKFLIGILIIFITAVWFGIIGFKEGQSYYLTADELIKMKDTIYDKHIKVAGKVVQSSVERDSKEFRFQIEQNNIIIPISYPSDEPVPDTFNDNAQVVISGIYQQNGIFKADAIQAKCASKYEAMNE
ncbi:unnamed protein product [marine sediment metagenome]|uniref:Cytochrome c-type biogenesis protein CcmE n=1 Tax=marine sediment metagenome TaxID=412755 RepID=X1NRR9_9ZZZZ